MSYRPTLSIYLDGSLVSVSFLMNFSDEDLFHEATAVSALCGIPDYCTALVQSCDTEFNEELLSCSEFPVVVDLDSGYIYVSYRQLTLQEINSLEEVSSPVRDYRSVLEHCRIPIFREDPCMILEMYEQHSSLYERLSSATADILSFMLYKQREAKMQS